MAQNFLQLNQDKAEVLVIGANTQREKLTSKLKSPALSPRHQAKNLGVILDSNLSFDAHIQRRLNLTFIT